MRVLADLILQGANPAEIPLIAELIELFGFEFLLHCDDEQLYFALDEVMRRRYAKDPPPVMH